MNQNPEQLARDRIDQQLTACGWSIQNKSSINLAAGIGIAICEYATAVGPAAGPAHPQTYQRRETSQWQQGAASANEGKAATGRHTSDGAAQRICAVLCAE